MCGLWSGRASGICMKGDDGMPIIPASPLPAAAYIRVSTEEQAELSPDSQLEEIEKYACREGITLLPGHIYIDAGISGKKARRRPAFMRMIAAAKEKSCPFSIILVWKYSRFARNQEESIFYKSILRSKCGIEVRSVTEPLAAGPFGSLIERIIEWMDEFYSIRLSQEVKRSMAVNAQRGKLQCPAAFGYRVEEGRLVPEAREAGLVPYIFNRFLDGKGLFSIARELNDLGARTHRGNRFESRTVEYILRNPVYIGKLRWNPAGRTRRDFSNENLIIADSDHPPLISPELWQAVQQRLDTLKAQKKPKARPVTEQKRWLSGIVRCSACGAPLIFAKPHYYKCGNYTRGRCTHSQHIRCDLLEEAVIFQLAADARAAEPLEYRITCRASEDSEADAERILRQIQMKKNRLQEAYLAGVLDLEEFSSTKRKLEEKEAFFQKEFSDLQAKKEASGPQPPLQTAIEGALETLQSASATLEQQHNAAYAVIESCCFDKTASLLSITYRARLPSFQ